MASVQDENYSDRLILQTIRHANHDMLVRSGNEAYTDLFAAYVALQSEMQLRKTLIYWQSKNVDLPQGSDSTSSPPLPDLPLPSPFLSADTSTSIPPLPQKGSYPKVQFWTRNDFGQSMQKVKKLTAHNSGAGGYNSRATRGGKASLRYLEDENGETINGRRLVYMRSLARHVFQHLHSQGMAPKTWTKANHDAQQLYREAMYTHFPILRLCEGHWKVDRLAIDTYPGWYRNNVATSRSTHCPQRTKFPIDSQTHLDSGIPEIPSAQEE